MRNHVTFEVDWDDPVQVLEIIVELRKRGYTVEPVDGVVG